MNIHTICFLVDEFHLVDSSVRFLWGPLVCLATVPFLYKVQKAPAFVVCGHTGKTMPFHSTPPMSIINNSQISRPVRFLVTLTKKASFFTAVILGTFFTSLSLFPHP